MNLYSHDDSWLMVDCGVTFNEPLNVPERGKAPLSETEITTPHFDRVCADPSFIANQKEHLTGIVITHAHEDHLGALVDLWPRLQCTVYTTAFTAICLRHKLADSRANFEIPIVEVSDGQRISIGPFEVQWLPLTHSLPESYSVIIRTRAGNVLHTGDWKIDHNPVVGKPFDPAPFKQLANESISAMVCDSTNADRPGKTPSEGDCHHGLLDVINNHSGRVLVTCFASNIGRLITLCHIAQQTQRYVALLGRSLHTMIRHAKAAGYWPVEFSELLYDPYQLGYLPPQDILLIATGSQGEPRAALARLATNQYRDIELEEGDCVIFSAIAIPGNEDNINRLIENLENRKIKVVTTLNAKYAIHASGHPSEQDLQQLYEWVKPQVAVPTHGEWQHLTANAQIANGIGVPRQLTGINGDLFELGQQKRVRKGFVTAKRIALT